MSFLSNKFLSGISFDILAARRLADDNRLLREQLTQARQLQESLQHRMDEARERVGNALSRLPTTNTEGA